MESILLFLTFASLAAAVGLAGVTWRVIRDERRRSAARVAALAAAIDGDDDAATPAGGGRPLLTPRGGTMGSPLLKVAGGVAMAVAVIDVIAMSADRTGETEGAMAADSGTVDSLDLLSMRHLRDADALTVTGLVRNPSNGVADGITAVVFAFDRNGGFVASGRAPLEFGALAPGDESPFQVTIPHAGDVGRYRVSFRTATGVIRHIDRRVETAPVPDARAARVNRTSTAARRAATN